MDDWDNDIRVSSDENPGIRILWLRSEGTVSCYVPIINSSLKCTNRDVVVDLSLLMNLLLGA